MSSSAWIGVVGGAVGGLFGSGGTLLAQALTLRHQGTATAAEWGRQDRLRFLQERRNLYADYINEFRAALRSSRDALLLRGDEDVISQFDNDFFWDSLTKSVSRLHELEAALDLIAPPDVRAAVGSSARALAYVTVTPGSNRGRD